MTEHFQGERRHGNRQLMIKLGGLWLGEDWMPCVVFDLSPRGARVHLGTPCSVSDAVLLRLPDGTVREAQRRWQRDEQAGFEFLEPVQSSEAVLH
ncbi:hypothetical protein J8J14_10675 [Roseomonas sp. SSH11]|uniref:PilZ domain-containing protein n=1 Tax=Pararoseomonas baculiformis TaxID=2820812 RepID=A0ABS4AE29_9PROT|nr:PilZ domain-containing protein [Pararoseomonas baculiformis]MBP0445244.1 hypothetical protein [Pararoseomonas baculiformis]